MKTGMDGRTGGGEPGSHTVGLMHRVTCGTAARDSVGVAVVEVIARWVVAVAARHASVTRNSEGELAAGRLLIPGWFK